MQFAALCRDRVNRQETKLKLVAKSRVYGSLRDYKWEAEILIRLAAIFLLFSLVGPALAQDSVSHFVVFGHDVSLTEIQGDRRLKVDDIVLKDDRISLKSILTVANTPILIGFSGGGAACNDSPFIVTLRKDGLATLDGPIATCRTTEMEVLETGLIFTTTPLPGALGEVWSWTPKDGLKKRDDIAYVPEDKGWKDLREGSINHPTDIFRYREIAEQAEELLGNEREVFLELLSGPGSGHFTNGHYLGKACMAHNCTRAGAMIYLDPDIKRVFLAWKPDGRATEIVPEFIFWPSAVQSVFEEWETKWK